MMKIVRIVVVFLALLLGSCGSNVGSNSDNTGNDFAQSSKMCQELDAEKCVANKACELVANVCIPKLPTVFAIETPNLPDVDKALVGRQITALSNGPVGGLYVGTDNGLISWQMGTTEKIDDFSGGNPALAGFKYVRAIGYSPIALFAFASVGKSGAPKDPDSKIIYEITQKTTFSTQPVPNALEITHIFESTPGVMVFGGEGITRYDILGARKFKNISTHRGVTTGIFNPNGSTIWLGTGGADVANHQGILFHSAQLKPISIDGVAKIEPKVWGSSTASPNANISSMAIFGRHVLVGLRAKHGDPQTGGLVVFDIHQSGKAINSKPFLVGTDVRNVIVGEFVHGNMESNRKKTAIVMATSNGLFELRISIDWATSGVSIESNPLNTDRRGNAVELKEIDHLFQKDSHSMYFSSNNKLYFLEVK